MDKKTLDVTNPEYFDLVRERTEQKKVLTCFEQTRELLKGQGVGTCLDLGCASGYLFHHIQDVIRHYTGLDASAAFLEYGREYFEKQGIKNIDLIHGWFESFEPGKKFDAVVCLGLFYVFPNFHGHLDRIFSMTNKLVVIRALFSDKTQFRYVPEMPGSKHYTYYNIYARKEIEEFSRSRGFVANWVEDRYVKSIGGSYETAGHDFPFEFLVLKP